MVARSQAASAGSAAAAQSASHSASHSASEAGATTELDFELLVAHPPEVQASWARIVRHAISLARVRAYWGQLGQYLQYVKARGKQGRHYC